MADHPPSNNNTTVRKRGSDDTQGGAPPPKQSSREPMIQELYVDLSHDRQNVLQPEQKAPVNELRGQTVDILRTDGRIHEAVISAVNQANNCVTVQWFESGVIKGKEIDVATLVAVNPHLGAGTNVGSEEHTNRTNGHVSSRTRTQVQTSYAKDGLDGQSPKIVGDNKRNTIIPKPSLSPLATVPDTGFSMLKPISERRYNGLTTALGVPECGICRDEMLEPRTLHCGHNICANCEPRLVDANRNILCPMCRKATTVPAEGLPMNFELAEIVKALKEAYVAGSGLAITDSADTPFGYRLFCGPKPLNDGKIKVSQTNVQKHGTIHVLYRGRGG